MNLVIVLKHFIKGNTNKDSLDTKFNTSLFSRLNCIELNASMYKGCASVKCWNCPFMRKKYMKGYEDTPTVYSVNAKTIDGTPNLIYLLKRIPDE